MMRAFAVVVVLGLVAAPARAQSSAVAIENVAVVDVERGRTVPGQTVVVEGRRITSVGPAAAAKVPQGARRIDGRGRYLIPGLWDMHVHAVTPFFGDYFLPVLIANGVTGVRDLFTTADAVKAWRDKTAKGAIAPRVGSFGSLVDGDPPIWGPSSVVAKTPADGRRVVDSLKAAGVDFVKVYSRLDPEVYAAIAARSKEIGIPYEGHIPSLVPATEALRLGQHTVEHLTQIVWGCSSREEALQSGALAAYRSPARWDSVGKAGRAVLASAVDGYDPARCARLADAFKASGAWLVPTIVVLRSIAYLDDSTLAADPRLQYIPGFLKTGWNPKTDFRFKMLTPADWRLRKSLHAREVEILKLFRQRGVPMLAGTDLANPYIFPGSSLHDELVNFVSIGMTPLEALRAATIEPARFFRATDSLGTVARGRLADLVLLGADPLADIKAVRSVEVVIADGRVFDKAAREAILAAAVTRAAQPPAQR